MNPNRMIWPNLDPADYSLLLEDLATYNFIFCRLTLAISDYTDTKSCILVYTLLKKTLYSMPQLLRLPEVVKDLQVIPTLKRDLLPMPEPKPASIPEPMPVSFPEPKPASIPEPMPASFPEPKLASIPEPKPASIPEPKADTGGDMVTLFE